MFASAQEADWWSDMSHVHNWKEVAEVWQKHADKMTPHYHARMVFIMSRFNKGPDPASKAVIDEIGRRIFVPSPDIVDSFSRKQFDSICQGAINSGMVFQTDSNVVSFLAMWAVRHESQLDSHNVRLLINIFRQYTEFTVAQSSPDIQPAPLPWRFLLLQLRKSAITSLMSLPNLLAALPSHNLVEASHDPAEWSEDPELRHSEIRSLLDAAARRVGGRMQNKLVS